MITDVGDVRRVHTATGVLAAFNTADVLDPADVHVATRLGRLGGEERVEVLLAAALAVRAVRLGSVCVDLATVSRTVLGEGDEPLDVEALPWPEPAAWLAACGDSRIVAVGGDAPPGRPLRLVAGLLYLERFWGDEERVRRSLVERAAAAPPAVDLARLRAGLAAHFSDPDAVPMAGPASDPAAPTAGPAGDPAAPMAGPASDPAARQRLAAAVGVLRHVTVLAGGPGTGKTTTVAHLLALLAEQPGPPLRIALAAPTGKAAARLQEAVSAALPPDSAVHRAARIADAATVHRLLGRRAGGAFRYGRAERLPYDVVVVDETSMVSLPMMARLLDAVRPQARLVLVGDPDQLASVEAGAVLGDLARANGRPEPELDAALAALDLPVGVINGVVTLERVWRFDGTIAAFAKAVQRGDADAAVALLQAGADDLELVAPDDVEGLRDDVFAAGSALATAASEGRAEDALAALEHHRVLCAHRRGPFGVTRWSGEVERWLAPFRGVGETWYLGRAVLVTANDYDTGLFNGDTGVVVATPTGPRVAFARGGPPSFHPPSRLGEVAGVHVMTVHRAQGSQVRRVAVVLPPPDSPLATRELLYTAVTRARDHVRILGTPESVRAAVLRPVARASGLRHRLGT